MARRNQKKQKPEKSSRSADHTEGTPPADDSNKPEKSKPHKLKKKDLKSKRKKHKGDGLRETVESIVVAFILAFLFRTFEAEAFVIPTGSMAPTLYGRHKDIVCPQCKHHFAVGASDELDKASGLLIENKFMSFRIKDAVCPNCRYVVPGDVVQNLPVFKGDRILVTKYPYEFGNPKRWDVVVFKFPEEPQTNYIKRLVGLPGESLEIRQGDVYARKSDTEPFRILRKLDPSKQRALQILVYDNDQPAQKLLEAGWPERWSGVKSRLNKDGFRTWDSDSNGWTQESRESRTYRLTSDGNNGLQWLRYRHFIPTEADWDRIVADKKPDKAKPQLIGDFCGYNAYRGGQNRDSIDLGAYWVGDLTINCEVDVEEAGDDAQVVLELVEGFRFYRCTFDVQSGQCTIAHSDDNLQLSNPKRQTDLIPLGTAETKLKGTGRHRVIFANVDDRLLVWVDGKPIDFEAANKDQKIDSRVGEYEPCAVDGDYQRPTHEDLCPVGIAARNCDVTVSKLLLQRDIYYRAEKYIPPEERERTDHTIEDYGVGHDDLTAPKQWWEKFSGPPLPAGERAPGHAGPRPARFAALGPDEFFMLGDNSPRSQDSRLWDNYRGAARRHGVPRKLLVGKAFFIYWPHGIPFMNDGKGYPVRYHYAIGKDGKPVKTDYPSFRLPFYPDIWRMHRIR